ncbi:MAG: hypothetical protein WDZ42_02405 [Candidatus Saccharimonadales bacterium]
MSVLKVNKIQHPDSIEPSIQLDDDGVVRVAAIKHPDAINDSITLHSDGTIDLSEVNIATATAEPTPDTIIKRDSNGSFQVSEPTTDSHPATLGYSNQTYLSKSGGSMSGSLDIPANGLAVGGDQITTKDGNVGIGTADPEVKLDVSGDLKVQGSRIVRKINVQVDSATRNHSASWGLGPTFDTITGFKAGSLIKIAYHVPMRNDSTGWGGGYIEPQISFDGGTSWSSLGSSGYDAVMNNNAPSIGSYFNQILVDPEQSLDFSVRVRFYYRSYDGTVTVNGSHAINTISGTATLMSGINGLQHYTKVIVEELY